jgi:hypothetical protein
MGDKMKPVWPALWTWISQTTEQAGILFDASYFVASIASLLYFRQVSTIVSAVPAIFQGFPPQT